MLNTGSAVSSYAALAPLTRPVMSISPSRTLTCYGAMPGTASLVSGTPCFAGKFVAAYGSVQWSSSGTTSPQTPR
jgi:hypothetical protein